MNRLLCLLLLMTFAGTTFASGSKDILRPAATYYEAGQYEAAAEELMGVIERNPHSVRAQEALGMTLLKLQRWAQAVERLLGAYELMPEYRRQEFWAALWSEVVSALSDLLDSGDWNEAVVALNEFQKLDSVSPESRERLSRVFAEYAVKLLSEGRVDEALSAFSRSAGIRQGETEAL